MNQLDYVKNLLQLMEENPKIPVKIKAEADDCFSDDADWLLLEFSGEPKLEEMCEWDDKIYCSTDGIEDDIRDDMEDRSTLNESEIDEYIEDYIAKNKKTVILLTVVGDGL